jgi:hypothetical protein
VISAQEIRQKTLAKMNELARENRSATLLAFRELLVPVVAAELQPDFPGVGDLALREAVDRNITIVANRLALDFDRIADELGAGIPDTDPTELVPDTERPV